MFENGRLQALRGFEDFATLDISRQFLRHPQPVFHLPLGEEIFRLVGVVRRIRPVALADG